MAVHVGRSTLGACTRPLSAQRSTLGAQAPSSAAGGGQEQGRRAGTENVGLAVGMGTAAEIVLRELPETAAHMRKVIES